MNEGNLPYIHDKFYPHMLLDLHPNEILDIITNSFIFVSQRLEVDLPELLSEIEISATREVSKTTIEEAVDIAENFMDDLMNTFSFKLDIKNFEKRRPKMKAGYMAVFNQPQSLRFVRYQDGADGVVSLPLVDALWKTCSLIFDYSITKSPEMNYLISKSSNQTRKKIRGIKRKEQVKYLFIQVLYGYGANELQLIRNFDIAFGTQKRNAINSLHKLPKVFKS